MFFQVPIFFGLLFARETMLLRVALFTLSVGNETDSGGGGLLCYIVRDMIYYWILSSSTAPSWYYFILFETYDKIRFLVCLLLHLFLSSLH